MLNKRQAPLITPAPQERQPPAPAPAEPPPAANAGPARRFYYIRQGGNSLPDLNLNDGSPDLAAVLARLDYVPIGGPAVGGGWMLFRQMPRPPGHKTRGLYVAASDTDGSAQVVIFLSDQQALIDFLRDYAPLYPLLPDLWNLRRLPGVPICSASW